MIYVGRLALVLTLLLFSNSTFSFAAVEQQECSYAISSIPKDEQKELFFSSYFRDRFCPGYFTESTKKQETWTYEVVEENEERRILKRKKGPVVERKVVTYNHPSWESGQDRFRWHRLYRLEEEATVYCIIIENVTNKTQMLDLNKIRKRISSKENYSVGAILSLYDMSWLKNAFLVAAAIGIVSFFSEGFGVPSRYRFYVPAAITTLFYAKDSYHRFRLALRIRALRNKLSPKVRMVNGDTRVISGSQTVALKPGEKFEQHLVFWL